MSEKSNTNKNIYYIKVMKYNISNSSNLSNSSNSVVLRREFDYSILNDYDKMYQKINNAIINIIKPKTMNDSFPIIILNHPEIKDIYIYCKEQWNLLYKYNIIQECFNNKSLKIWFILEDQKNKELILSHKKIIDNKKEIMKYIIKNLSLDLYLNSLTNFLTINDLMRDYELYLLNDIINNDINPMTNNDKENLDENINIDKILNNKETNLIKKIKKMIRYDKDYYIQLNKDNKDFNNYYIHQSDFISILDERFKKFSKQLQSFIEIEKILKTDKEKDKSLSDIEQEERFSHKTSLDLKNDQSLEKMSLISDDNSEINNNILLTVLNPPHQYVTNLMSNDKFFKKFNKNEYYIGIEDYKDNLNREYIEIFSKKS
jgi:hypothetical protein